MNMLQFPVVSLFVDNRSNSPEDIHQLTGVEIKGRVETANQEDRAYFRKFYVMRFPELTDFYDSPDSALIKVKVARYEFIENFMNVKALEML